MSQLNLIWQNCIAFNLKSSEIANQASLLKRASDKLVKKLKIFELQDSENKDQEMVSQPEEEDDFGLLVDQHNYVKFDEKVKLAELLKSCSRDKLTRVVQLVRNESGHD